MKTFYNLVPDPEGVSRLYIDGEIVSGNGYTDWWGDTSVGSREFRQALEKLGDVDVYINSPGGDVFAGAEMYSALKMHEGRVRVKIMGIAASAASMVAMAGDEVLISPVGSIMIHDPWSYVAGNAREMEHEAQVLREIGEGIAAAYVAKTGLSTDEVERMLADETWLNAQSAIDLGFADGLWDFAADTKAISQATSPAATMRGRSYTPAAYMAKMGVRKAQEKPAPAPAPDSAPQARKAAREAVRKAAETLS